MPMSPRVASYIAYAFSANLTQMLGHYVYALNATHSFDSEMFPANRMFVDRENTVTNVGTLHARAKRNSCTLDFIK